MQISRRASRRFGIATDGAATHNLEFFGRLLTARPDIPFTPLNTLNFMNDNAFVLTDDIVEVAHRGIKAYVPTPRRKGMSKEEGHDVLTEVCDNVAARVKRRREEEAAAASLHSRRQRTRPAPRERPFGRVWARASPGVLWERGRRVTTCVCTVFK